MATPTRQVVSTPKNPLSTPNRPTASPRPNTAVFPNRPFSHKSPAVKTPASLTGQSHRFSVSSHPTSTPLAAIATHDDLMNLNSPGAAALMASIGQTGLTPLPTSQDRLGISNDMTMATSKDSTVPRDPQAERNKRLQEVADTLRAKIGGKGITKDGVIAIARAQGFDILEELNVLTIAGKVVELDITFEGLNRDEVTAVNLKLNLPEAEDAQPQKEASTILRDDLSSSLHDSDEGPWGSLDRFAQNLRRLGCLDNLETSSNCFQLETSLYDTFRRIWDEEKKRTKWRHDMHHLCQGNVGRPTMDANGTLRSQNHYWTSGRDYYSANITSNEEEQTSRSSKNTFLWAAEFSFQKGNPGISTDRNWIGNDPLSTSISAENLFGEVQVDKPSWEDSSASQSQKQEAAALGLEQMPISDGETLDVQFVCHLKPRVLLPAHIVGSLNAPAPMIDVHPSKVQTFQQALEQAQDGSFNPGSSNMGDGVWRKPVVVMTKSGVMHQRQHVYKFTNMGSAVAYPAEALIFSHPRQFAAAVPVLRQYALVETLLRSMLPIKPVKQTQASNQPSTTSGSLAQSHDRVIKRNNKKKVTRQGTGDGSGPCPSESTVQTIDVRLDVASDVTKVKLRIVAQLPSRGALSTDRHAGPGFLDLTAEIGLNGVIEVSEIKGGPGSCRSGFYQKVAKVLRLSEDIGMTVEWLFMENQKSQHLDST